MRKSKKIISLSACAAVLAACATTASSQMKPFGDEDSIRYADKLWATLSDARLVGPNTILAKPYQGQHPHGAVLDNMESEVTVDGHTGAVIVKKNYGGEGVSIDGVANNPERYLMSVTVMYKREAGYDPANQNWFWAKYTPDGGLAKNPKGMALAGRVAKGMPKGCIACHGVAPGDDYVYSHDRYAP
ncbi:MAG: cytochrome P460 family protein [Gammaproteobacteria bacterium]|nr:cytochrome P460 family protein [Gammaproteobacteria bacterium]NIR84296.1 cytochrome P460 family protein [Gammaproteobacteria bacterium]NIR89766.1 cytochrome P460 family protein [Gammaproteobacteria bacterium]NIU05454.1 cytochrome P460 family protein [Gammaproteobacteria bacterium]NIV52401.1 hypothetical protein [Gammaproteobacteria bacterium]